MENINNSQISEDTNNIYYNDENEYTDEIEDIENDDFEEYDDNEYYEDFK
jgi:hypothetical protein